MIHTAVAMRTDGRTCVVEKLGTKDERMRSGKGKRKSWEGRMKRLVSDTGGGAEGLI